MDKLIVIAGPTASGKTAVSVELAKRLDGEIVSVDSMQIYKYMDIGTAKASESEKQGIKHYMLDFLNPEVNFSVNEYAVMADKCIAEIIKKKKVPILAGGTGLYINSVIYNYNLTEVKSDPALRQELTDIYNEKGGEYLLSELKKFDPVSAERLHPNNGRRIIRAVEMYKTSGKTMSEQIEITKNTKNKYDVSFFCLSPDREILYNRINKRVDDMLKKGLVDEVKSLVEMGISKGTTAMQAIGYKEILMYLDGKISLSDAADIIKQESRRYAKRQLTWFRRNEGAVWLDIDRIGGVDKTVDIIAHHT